MRIVVVGAGVLGTMHAWWARRLGHDVVHLERDAEPRSASVRNFGLVWVSGRRAGGELRTALRARELWDQVAAAAPDVGLRAVGSLTVAADKAERGVLDAACALPDAADRGFELLDPDEARARNPALRGSFEAALWCGRDAVVEPTRALPAIRAALSAADPDRYRYLPARDVVDCGTGWVRDHTGDRHPGDLVVLCPGARHTVLAAAALEAAGVRRCRLQMMQTAPLDEPLATAVADGDSLRYYPAFASPALGELPPQPPVAAEHRMQLLMVQRASGELTVGDTHAYDEPFDFAVDEAPYDHLRARVEAILGRPLPPAVRRWAGVYSLVDEGVCARVTVDDDVVAVTGPGGRGMTLSPAIAETTFAEVGLC